MPPPAQVTGERLPAHSRGAFVPAHVVPSPASHSTLWGHPEVMQIEGGRLRPHRSYVCTNKSFNTSDGSVQFEWSQEELKKDKDTFWEFHRYAPRNIESSVCAQNCTWRCDEIRLRIEWRSVLVRVSPASQRVPPPVTRKSRTPHPTQVRHGGHRRQRHHRPHR
jgi:hypothetical protein